MVLSITSYGPYAHDGCYAEKGQELMGNTLETASTHEDRTDAIHKIVHGIDVSGEVCQVGHGACWCEQTAEKKHAHHKEPHHKDRLLHRVAVVGDDETETAPEECQQHGQGKDEPQWTLAGNAIDEPRENKTYHNDKQGYNPIWDKFGKYERPFWYGGDIDLLDGARLLLTHYIECGQKTAHQHHHHGEESGNHEHLIVEVLF